MNKTTLRTSISNEEKKVLMEFGKGKLNQGISNLIRIANSKEITVRVITDISL